VVQLIANTVIAGCLAREFFFVKTKERWLYIGALLPLSAFAIDVLGTKLAIWKGGVISQCVFIVLVAVAAIMVLKFIPSNINAVAKAKALEMETAVLNAELAESRISTMMSQIRPHFIYNTLGSIEQLCLLDPPKAGVLVHIFAKYLVKQKNTWFIFDTIGLALFNVVGIEKTLQMGFPLWTAITMGSVTGAAGGVIRDVLINEVPLIFRKEIYALACVAGGIVYSIMHTLGFESSINAMCSSIVVVAVRCLAVKYHWHLPIVRGE
jgi:hypothetical protein